MLFMGLNEEFSSIRGQIPLMDPLPPITRVYSLVIQEEKHREVGSSIKTNVDTLAFMNKRDENSRSNFDKQQYIKKKCYLYSLWHDKPYSK